MSMIQILANGGEIIDVEMKKKSYLHKADRLIDHQTIRILQELKPAEYWCGQRCGLNAI